MLGVLAGCLVLSWLPVTEPPPGAVPQAGNPDANTFEIPESARALRNPVTRSTESVRHARVLWRTHCESCHGASGRGDGPDARLHERRKGFAPRDLTDPAVQENLTDGEIYWRIAKGIVEGDNIIMPAYEQKVPAELERWHLVLFVREVGRARRGAGGAIAPGTGGPAPPPPGRSP